MEHLKSMEDLQKLVTEALDKEDEVHQKQWEMQNLQNLLSSGKTEAKKEPQFICQEGHGEVEFYCKNEQKFMCHSCMVDNEDNTHVVRVTADDIVAHAKFLLGLFEEVEQKQKAIRAKLEYVKYSHDKLDNEELEEIFDEAEQFLTTPPVTDPDTLKKLWFMGMAEVAAQNPELASEILSDPKKQEAVLKMITGTAINEAKLLYKASRDGMSAQMFHNLCDNKGATVTIIKTEGGKVFGAYTDIPWTSGEYKKKVAGKGNSFLWAIDSKNKVAKFKCLKPDAEVYHYADRLPVFGEGHFLHLDGNMTGSTYPKSLSYEAPNVDDPAAFIAGGKNFKAIDIEVHQVSNNSGKKEKKATPAPKMLQKVDMQDTFYRNHVRNESPVRQSVMEKLMA